MYQNIAKNLHYKYVIHVLISSKPISIDFNKLPNFAYCDVTWISPRCLVVYGKVIFPTLDICCFQPYIASLCLVQEKLHTWQEQISWFLYFTKWTVTMSIIFSHAKTYPSIEQEITNEYPHLIVLQPHGCIYMYEFIVIKTAYMSMRDRQ